ncbi:RHS repeat-associated core domain-containing protein [Macellibacteroides fermentans]|uniref:RHS repeat-associated core domain-containing protein n=1 Tax=Macellibacteroides fermentans TaxID=879969 RepID=UPI00406BF0DF
MNGASSTGTEYVYDANGSLVQDYNKKIAKIQYNLLNLPSMLQFQNGNTTSYQYSNYGVKRKVTHQTAIANVVIPMGSIQPLSTGQIAYTSTTDYCGNVIYEDGILSKILTSEGYITLSGTTPTYHYYLKDHLGNNRVVIDQNGSVEQVNHYYPFGGLFGEGTSNTNQAYKYNGKELDRMHGLDWYDYGARNYDAALPVWTTVDPLAEKYYNSSPYAYCANNPILNIDPDGRETRVAMNDDGTYRVIGGELNKDRNIYVYTQNKDGNYTVRGNSIGISSSTTSFYNSDANGGKGAWAVGSIINPNDQSGENFLSGIIGNNPPMFNDYIANAGNGEKYDFKTTNGTDKPIEGIDEYRGMPIGGNKNTGVVTYSSARDIGNITAGYVAGANGMSWEASRIAFDAYQSKVSRRLTIEGISTRNAEKYGWSVGSNVRNNTPTQKANNLLRSIWNLIKE